jgi:hypothetical protein
LKTDRGLTSCGGSNPSTCAIECYSGEILSFLFSEYVRDYRIVSVLL